MDNNTVKIFPVGGVGNVTKNMYAYEYGNEILLVDCGLGFADETMPGVDLLIPDITYLKNTTKKIVGLVITHGHEDHIGALPFVLPQLPKFPVYGTALTAALATEKLIDFGLPNKVLVVNPSEDIRLGSFNITYIHITHSILDAAHIFIRTPVGNFYHGSDFKFDFTPVDGRPSDLGKIAKVASEGVLCLLEDCVGVEKPGHSRSEKLISDSFAEEFRKAKGRVFMTTYASNISRLNQAIQEGTRLGRKVCFLGRSLIKSRDIGRKLGYMDIPKGTEVKPNEAKRLKPSEVLIILTGAQAQESSALVRVSNDEDENIRMTPGDTVIFSADPIPGNEVNINNLIDMIAKRGVKVVYSGLTDEFHVSGHGSENDIKLLISLTRPKYLFPIGGTYKHMAVFRDLAKSMEYDPKNVVMLDNGQEGIFTKDGFSYGGKRQLMNVFVDQVTGGTVDNYVVHDRRKIAEEGVVIVIAEVSASTGQLIGKIDLLSRGMSQEGKDAITRQVESRFTKMLSKQGNSGNINWIHIKKMLGKTAEEILIHSGREPLIVPVLLEV